SGTAARLAERFWPGPLTLVMPAARQLAREVSGGTGTVGGRVPARAIARAVCAACGHPVTATSANLSGEPAVAAPDDVERALGDRVEFMLDAGRTPGGAPSTIVDVTAAEPRLVRAGAIGWDEIQAWLHSARAYPLPTLRPFEILRVAPPRVEDRQARGRPERRQEASGRRSSG